MAKRIAVVLVIVAVMFSFNPAFGQDEGGINISNGDGSPIQVSDQSTDQDIVISGDQLNDHSVDNSIGGDFTETRTDARVWDDSIGGNQSHGTDGGLYHSAQSEGGHAARDDVLVNGDGYQAQGNITHVGENATLDSRQITETQYDNSFNETHYGPEGNEVRADANIGDVSGGNVGDIDIDGSTRIGDVTATTGDVRSENENLNNNIIGVEGSRANATTGEIHVAGPETNIRNDGSVTGQNEQSLSSEISVNPDIVTSDINVVGGAEQAQGQSLENKNNIEGSRQNQTAQAASSSSSSSAAAAGDSKVEGSGNSEIKDSGNSEASVKDSGNSEASAKNEGNNNDNEQKQDVKVDARTIITDNSKKISIAPQRPEGIGVSAENLAFPVKNPFGAIKSEILNVIMNRYEERYWDIFVKNIDVDVWERWVEDEFMNTHVSLYQELAPVSSVVAFDIKQIAKLVEANKVEANLVGVYSINPKVLVNGLFKDSYVDEKYRPTQDQMRTIAFEYARNHGANVIVQIDASTQNYFRNNSANFSLSALFTQVFVQANPYNVAGNGAMAQGSANHFAETRLGASYAMLSLDLGKVFELLFPEEELVDAVKSEVINLEGLVIPREVLDAYELIAHCPNPNMGNARKRIAALKVLKDYYLELDDELYKKFVIVLMRDCCKQGIGDLAGNVNPAAKLLRSELYAMRAWVWGQNANLVGVSTPEGKACLAYSMKYWGKAAK